MTIIDEQKDFIVVNKPAGLVVHGSEAINRNSDEKTLVDFLLEKYPEIRKVGDDPWRPGIVHRLDRDASGLMVIARNQNAFEFLKKQFQDRTINKWYTTLVYGKISKQTDEITFPIERGRDGKMNALPKTVKGEANDTGRNAHTEFHIVTRFINYTLLKVKIKTGRTHQIRCHMAAYGNPIVGDKIYSTAKTRIKNAKVKLDRIFLVADELEFTAPDGERKNYKIDLPTELVEFMKIVK